MKSWNQAWRRALPAAGALLLVAGAVGAPEERYRLYSDPDPASGGGMRGEIVSPDMPIEQILAVPPDEPRLVYKGDVSGPGRKSFSFQGLPMRKYDLVVIYPDRFYEGLSLQRGEDTLTPEDRRKIKETIDKAEPYFNKKIIHRLEGTTGRGNLCRCVCTYIRDKVSKNSPKGSRNLRRAFKIVILKDVGPGWQVVRARDMYPTWTTRQQIIAEHVYTDQLSGIRVTRDVRDLGELKLSPTR